MNNHEETAPQKIAKLIKLIQEGIQSLEKGELYDGTAIFKKLRDDLEEPNSNSWFLSHLEKRTSPMIKNPLD